MQTGPGRPWRRWSRVHVYKIKIANVHVSAKPLKTSDRLEMKLRVTISISYLLISAEILLHNLTTNTYAGLRWSR